MTLKLIEEKKQKICDLCTKLFEKSKPTIRFVAQVIGNIVSSFPAVPLGPLFYNGSIRNRQDCRTQKTQIELWCWNWVIQWSIQWTCLVET